MLTLDNFEKQTASAIVQRGRNYYNDGLVAGLEETADNIWSAEVYGSADYSVEVSLNDANEVHGFSCDCPYDGPLCKHVVAALFAIREEKTKAEGKKTVNSAGKQKKSTFDALLNAVSLDEYRDFVRRHALRDKDFKTTFELFFSEKMVNPDVEKKYGDLIRKLVRKHSDHGYIDYRSSRQLASEVDKLLAQGRDMTARGNFRDAFLLSKVALKELIEAVEGCDDSGGDVGGAISEAIELLAGIAKSDDAAPIIKQEVFDYLRTELTQEAYFSYGDFGYEMFSVFRTLAVQSGQSTAFVDFIDRQCRKLTGKHDEYRKDFYQKQKIGFYREIGWDDAAEKLIRQNMNIVEIRQAEVGKAISRKDYTAAKDLIADGIRTAEEKGHSGTIAEWKKELLQIAVLENDTNAIRRLARYFAFDRGFNTDYYQQWKQTHPVAEQKDAVEKLIAERIDEADREYSKHGNSFFGASQPPHLRYVGPLYIKEQMWDRLLALVQTANRLDALLEYHEHLAKRYPKEMLALYIPKFRFLGDQVDGRSQYADLAGKMKRVLKDIPEAREPVTVLVRELIAKNPRRSAMIEELNKVLKV
jgi:hypothetical protein